MLAEKVFIFQPNSLGSGLYTFALYFQNPSKPQFLNLNDYVEDTAGHKYKVISPSVIPATDGETLTVQFVNADVLPVQDSDYTSTAYTPGQVNFEPAVKTSGALTSPSLSNGPNFEWNVTAGWNNPAEANKAVVGDRVVDFLGKEYEITFLNSTSRFNSPIKVAEVERVGLAPASGDATLYRPTSHFKFFQGTELTDPARTVIQNRDIKRVDLNLNAAGSGVKCLENIYMNSSGSTLSLLTPVKTSGGAVSVINPSLESDVTKILGVTKESINNGTSGLVVLEGLIEDVTTSLNVDDVVYLSKSGGLTSTVPEVGVGGFATSDFVVRLGMITRNSSNSSSKDLMVKIELVGQL